MMSKLLITAFIFVTLLSTIHSKSFKVNFQSTEKWSNREMMKYRKDIPELTDFTVCHWEFIRYFSSSENTVWNYCSLLEKQGNETFHCIGLYSTGIRDYANQKLKIGVWLEGWSKPAISDAIDVLNYRHRTWNHICWSYSGVSSINLLFFNGDLVGEFETRLPDRSMVKLPVHDSRKSVASAFIIGQDQDIISGAFDSAESFIGEISELNMWSPMLDSDSIRLMAKCLSFEQGNIVSWDKRSWQITIAKTEDLNYPQVLCEERKQLTIFPQPTSFSHASYMCQMYGGELVVPRSEIQNDEVIKLLLKHRNACMNQKEGSSITEGKSIWLGFERVGYEWVTMTDRIALTTLNFSKLIQSGVQMEMGCTFMYQDGTWGASFSQTLCNSMQLCYICEIRVTPIFTLKGLCAKGTPFDWNYYMHLNSSGQIEHFDGYKRSAKIKADGANWLAETSGSRIHLNMRRTPIGRLEWEWFEASCNSEQPQKRELAFSKCLLREEFTCNSGHCILQSQRCNGKNDCEDGSDEDDSCNLVIIPKSYKKSKPPKLEGTNIGTKIITKLKVVSIDKIDSVNMNVGLTVDLNMKWLDPRVQFRNLLPGQKHILDQETADELWLPFQTLVFENAIIGKTLNAEYYEVSIKAGYNSSLSPFESLNPYRTLEDVWYQGKDHPLQAKRRLKVEYFCNFYLLQFPFDIQKCNLTLKMQSTKNSAVYFSQEKSEVELNGDKDFREFHVTTISSFINQRSQDENNTTGNENDNTFTLSMELKRDFKDHVISIFFPELLLWFLAYITIFLKIYDISNRSRISVTILLVLVALIGNIKDKIPHTPYFKFVDIWSIWYLSNIFLITCFHVFMEYSMDDEPMNPELNATYPSDSMYDMEDEKKEHERYQNRKKINYLAAIFFPISTMVFNVVYFLSSTV